MLILFISVYYCCCCYALVVKLKVLLNTKAVGLDGFSMKVIKYITKDIYVPLSIAFISSFVAGVFPDALKLAKVGPVFKSGNKFNITNSRPISVLPILSNVLEKLMYNRLLSFMNSCKLLWDNQFSFR